MIWLLSMIRVLIGPHYVTHGLELRVHITKSANFLDGEHDEVRCLLECIPGYGVFVLSDGALRSKLRGQCSVFILRLINCC